jgi:hypothetical protein|tara:strand:+ start:207 stop:509 length:303 start_codon:yes stop_codon:yes gene_type:complete
MKKMKFESTDEFERVFKTHDKEITDAIVLGIEEAYKFHKKTANLFEISFDEAELVYEISLPSNQWEIALESCMDHYRNIGEIDSSIDVYLLQKEVRKWLS